MTTTETPEPITQDITLPRRWTPPDHWEIRRDSSSGVIGWLIPYVFILSIFTILSVIAIRTDIFWALLIGIPIATIISIPALQLITRTGPYYLTYDPAQGRRPAVQVIRRNGKIIADTQADADQIRAQILNSAS